VRIITILIICAASGMFIVSLPTASANSLAYGTPVEIDGQSVVVQTWDQLVTPLPVVTLSPASSPVVPVYDLALPIVTPTTGGLPMVPITVTSPITVVTYLPTPVETTDQASIIVLMSFILSKIIVYTIIVNLSAVRQMLRLELLLLTMMFIAVDIAVFFPRYEHYDPFALGLLYNFVVNLENVWWVFWFVLVMIIPKFITFLAKDIAHVVD
jgi:hypothetical protein